MTREIRLLPFYRVRNIKRGYVIVTLQDRPDLASGESRYQFAYYTTDNPTVKLPNNVRFLMYRVADRVMIRFSKDFFEWLEGFVRPLEFEWSVSDDNG
jgi:hypothetical protein